jgi:hypothetical protein
MTVVFKSGIIADLVRRIGMLDGSARLGIWSVRPSRARAWRHCVEKSVWK